MSEVTWLEDPLGPYHPEDSLERDDADGVSLGSPSSTGEPLGVEELSPEPTTIDPHNSNDDPDIGVNSDHHPSPLSGSYSPGTTATREDQLKLLIASRPNYNFHPAIIRRNDSNGAIHFQDSGHASSPPLLSPSSLRPFASQSRDSFAAAGGLVVSKLGAKGNSSSKLPSKLPEQPAGQDGRFTSAQKGKKRAPTTIQKESSFPNLLYPPDFKLDKRPPKEKAGDRDIRIERNFIHIHELLTQDRSVSGQLLTALNKLQSDFTGFLSDFNHTSQPSSPPFPLPLPTPSPLSTPTSPLPTFTPDTQDSLRTVTLQTGSFGDLLSRITDGPSPPARASLKRPRSEHDHPNPSPSKLPRIASPLQLGHDPSTIMVAPARWAVPTSSAAIIAVIGRWQPFFEARGARLPLPDLAEHVKACEDKSYVVRLSFTDASLNTFMRTWKTHQPYIPEIFDISMTRSSVY
ncbi:hypothetical protein F5051DRAFT_401523 [Lentinula edodes]|nr:hypothetical protein F5051DRAFT_401523 [Lentinula edodes]